MMKLCRPHLLPAASLARGPALASSGSGAAELGLPKLSATRSEVFKCLCIIKSAAARKARGEGAVQKMEGCRLVPIDTDGGCAGGVFALYDISNPCTPIKVSQADTSGLHKPHGFDFAEPV
jgi:hypothetical protein